MKTLKYSIILLVMISVATFTGCNGKKLDEHGHEAGTHAESTEKESHEEHKEGKAEEEELIALADKAGSEDFFTEIGLVDSGSKSEKEKGKKEKSDQYKE